MDTRLTLASLHLLALGFGLAGVWSRARALRHVRHDATADDALRRAFTGDTWWGIAAVLWLVTGAWRLLAGTEKSTSYYFGNHAFFLKMALFAAIVALEVWPMKTLVRCRRRNVAPSGRDAGRIEAISYVQCALLVVTVLAAASMARGAHVVLPPGGAHPATATTTSPTAAPTADSLDAQPLSPSGVETVTAQDVVLLTHEIAMPLDGVDPAALHSNFAELRGGGSRRHEALDLMAPRRTPIHAAAAGRVLKLFTSTAGGLMVYAADSSERFIMLYAHLDGYAPGLRDGVRVSRGQLLGYVGSTGNASADAPHLHFAVARSADVKHWSRGQPIDPLPVLQAAARGSATGG